jgi:hypothetical protein
MPLLSGGGPGQGPLPVIVPMRNPMGPVSTLPHLFAELPLTPKTNDHQQTAVEPDLKSLLPTTVEPPKYAMNHGG